MSFVQAVRQLDFVVTTAYHLSAQAMYADIVLPCTTMWETVGGFTGHQRRRESLIVYTQVMEPLYEAKTDTEIGIMLARALGFDPSEFWPVSEKQAFFDMLAGSTVQTESGELEPLLTITQDDIEEWGCEGTPQEGRVALAQFLADGAYTVERKEGDGYGFIAYEDFINDPEAHPLPSDSGKFGLYCDYKSDMLNSMGYSPDGTFKPYANYVETPEGREGMFKDRVIGGEPSEYPFIQYQPHYLRRAHHLLDNCQWLREAWTNPVWLNSDDAAAKGIADGDTVRVYSAYGSVLRQASLTQTIMPGCVALSHGTWFEYDEDNQIDKAGTDNVLYGSSTGGMGTSGYNNINCNYEKYAGEALVPDAEWPARSVDL